MRTWNRLQQAGFNSWNDVIERSHALPFSQRLREGLVRWSLQALDRLQKQDIAYFIRAFRPVDHWRILQHFWEKCTFFDIETTSLNYLEARISTLACWHKGELLQFTRGENLDDFLDLLEECELLVSFNGGSFDVPFVLNTWHLPELPCPHLDVRWVCYHQGYRGGQKAIEQQLGLLRPRELADVRGEDAVWLWERWSQYGCAESLHLLKEYCARDVLHLREVSARMRGGG